MPIDKTPQYEQVDRQSVEPAFSVPDPLPPPPLKNSSSSQTKGRKSKSTAKSVLQAGQRARQVGSVSLGKRGLPPAAAEATKRSRVEEDHSAQFDPDETTHSHSQNKSSKAISHTTRSFGGSKWGYRSSVVCRDTGGKVFEELVLCSRVGSFLENSDLGHRFASFSAKANTGRSKHIGGRMAIGGTVDLVIADMPEDLHVPGLSDGTPEWNSVGDMYDAVFRFASTYLDDDGRLLLLLPLRLLENLEGNDLLKIHGFEISIDWLCHQPYPLSHRSYRSKETYSFTAALLQKTGQVGDEEWDRTPAPSNLNPDLELVDTKDDPLKFLFVRNSVTSPSLMPDGKPWRGTQEKSDVSFQILIEACSGEGSIVADLTASCGASLRACRASGRHFFGLESDPKIFDALLKPVLKDVLKTREAKAGIRRKKQTIPTGKT